MRRLLSALQTLGAGDAVLVGIGLRWTIAVRHLWRCISWAAAGLIAVGSLIGGFLGAHYGRRLSPGVLRVVIVVVGLIGLYRLLSV